MHWQRKEQALKASGSRFTNPALYLPGSSINLPNKMEGDGSKIQTDA
jgi:hypothetical protein